MMPRPIPFLLAPLVVAALALGSCKSDGPSQPVCQDGLCCQDGVCCAEGLGICGGQCVDMQSSADNCGSCGQACPAGLFCRDGGCGCPSYQALCGGSCLPTSSDPRNCGGCGVTCSGGQVCSAGKCLSGCQPGLQPCNGGCFDILTDNANCGSCNMACGTGQGCVNGGCVPAVALGPTPAMCAGGGPPLQINTGTSQSCAGILAQTTFRFSLCSCQNVVAQDELVTDAFDSSQGPYVPGGLGGGMGLNGGLNATNVLNVGGALWASAGTGVTATAPMTVRQELHVGGPLRTALSTIGGDAHVAGDVTANNPMSIAATLRIPATAMTSGPITYKALVRQPVSVPPPCDCAAGQRVPIAAIVAARQTANDNGLIGLNPDLYTQATAPARLDLPCGHYYLSRISRNAPLVIAAHGRTALYVGGDVMSTNRLTITLDSTAELDLFIAGNLSTTDSLAIGSPNYPALSRTYIGSSMQFSGTNKTLIAGNLYAGYAPILWTDEVDVYGSAYAGDFRSTGKIRIHYDRHVIKAGALCAPPTPTTQCSSCRDCGNQACVGGTCGQCSSNDDCCAPLSCVSGSCIYIAG